MSCLRSSWKKVFQWWTPRRLGYLSLSIGFFGMIHGPIPYISFLKLTDSYRSLSPELIGIGIAVLIIDAAYQRRNTEREKERLILQMGSPDNAFAREAVRTLSTRGWLYDGTLHNARFPDANLQGATLVEADLRGVLLSWADLRDADLSYANLQGADLSRADLKKANLWKTNLNEAILNGADLSKATLYGANLCKARIWDACLSEAYLSRANLREASLQDSYMNETCITDANLSSANMRSVNLYNSNLIASDLNGADLREADLERADVTYKQLVKVNSFASAIMPDGMKYDGRLNLPGDLEWALERDVDTDYPEAMAAFYEVTLEEYLRGQDPSQAKRPWLRIHIDYFNEAQIEDSLLPENHCICGVNRIADTQDQDKHLTLRKQDVSANKSKSKTLQVLTVGLAALVLAVISHLLGKQHRE